jgi:hypothetical protein
MTRGIRAALLFLASAGSASGSDWQFEVAPYFWAPSVEATVGIRRLPTVSVEASFGDILDQFDIGLLGRFNARKGRFGFGTDFLWLNLGAQLSPDRPVILILEPEVDMRQFVGEGFATFRFAEGAAEKPIWAEAILGARYFHAKTGFHLVGGAVQEGSLDFVDVLVGVRARAPLGEKAGILVRTDVGLFGSDFTWNAESQLELRLSKQWSLSAGYRYLDIDYEKGTGSDRILFQAVFKGPVLQATYAW